MTNDRMMIRVGRQEVKEQMMRRVVRLVNSGGQIATNGKGGVTAVQTAPIPCVGSASAFSREEEAYLVWGEDALRAFKTDLDEDALAEIGLTDTEINGLKGLWRVYQKAGTPSGACGDELRYLLAGLDWLPRQDKCKAHVTEPSFLQSVSCLTGKNEKTGQSEYSLVLRRVLREAAAAGCHDTWLSHVFAKVVRWCDCFASIHGLVDTSRQDELASERLVQNGTRTNGVGVRKTQGCQARTSACIGGARVKEAEDGPRMSSEGKKMKRDRHLKVSECDNEIDSDEGKATEKQQRFLHELVSARYGESTAMGFDFSGVSREEASRQIELLREMRDERVESVDRINTGRRDTQTWQKNHAVIASMC